VRDGIIKSPAGEEFQLPTTAFPPHAIHGYGFESSWQEIGPGRSMLHLPKPYGGATVEQTIEVLDDAIRWSLEYDPGDCELPAWMGLHPWFVRDLDRGGSAEIEFSAAKMLQRDSDGLPDGQIISPTAQPWDDAFTELQKCAEHRVLCGKTLRELVSNQMHRGGLFIQKIQMACVLSHRLRPLMRRT